MSSTLSHSFRTAHSEGGHRGPGSASGARDEGRRAHEGSLRLALMMRETLETPGRTAALVTPDQVLGAPEAAAGENSGFGRSHDGPPEMV